MIGWAGHTQGQECRCLDTPMSPGGVLPDLAPIKQHKIGMPGLVQVYPRTRTPSIVPSLPKARMAALYAFRAVVNFDARAPVVTCSSRAAQKPQLWVHTAAAAAAAVHKPKFSTQLSEVDQRV